MRASAASIEELLRLKYGPVDQQSWGPRLRAKFDYITPDDEYEALLLDLVCPATEWLDVGCGRNIIHCKAAAEQLAARCRRLVGIDPSENILENTLVHERAQCMLEDYRTEQPFDLITLKMVAEHITDPEGAVGAMRRLLRGGGACGDLHGMEMGARVDNRGYHADVGAPSCQGGAVRQRGAGQFSGRLQDEYAAGT